MKPSMSAMLPNSFIDGELWYLIYSYLKQVRMNNENESKQMKTNENENETERITVHSIRFFYSNLSLFHEYINNEFITGLVEVIFQMPNK